LPAKPASQLKSRGGSASGGSSAHAFEYACAFNDVDHRLTKPKHPWTNGQVKRMKSTIKDATKRRFYETHNELRVRLPDFVDA
jgi:hypothetical protein